MKVIKNGKIDLKNWRKKVVCGKKYRDDKEGCDTELEITKDDLIIMYWHGTHFPHYYPAIKCPLCEKHNAVNDIPDALWEELATAEENANNAIFDGRSQAI